jgi:hypothetical protein
MLIHNKQKENIQEKKKEKKESHKMKEMKIPNIYLQGVFHDLFDMIEENKKPQ